MPLSKEALALLESIPRFAGTDLIFPGKNIAKPLTPDVLEKVVRTCSILEAPNHDDPDKPRGHAVPHGFRSTFTDWARERTHHDEKLALVAIAHRVLNDSDGAYMRGDLFEKRRALMQDWSSFVTSDPAQGTTGNVVSFPSRAA